uniref:Uncharacterized protein n=1 Tax=Cannabis sativa TaxID=3483 RepID=A0A803NSJ6_CANSA
MRLGRSKVVRQWQELREEGRVHLARAVGFEASFDHRSWGLESFANFPVTTNIAEMPTAFTTPETVQDDNWYPELGASHHLTPDSSNLGASTSYAGNEQVLVGNGVGLNIESVGLATLLPKL